MHPANSAANPDNFESTFQSGKNKSDNVWTANLDIFKSDDVAKSCPVSYRTINQYGGTTCRPSFSRVNPDTMRYVWTGEFDLNTLCMDKEMFESGKKKLWIKKYPDTCGQGLSFVAMFSQLFCFLPITDNCRCISSLAHISTRHLAS